MGTRYARPITTSFITLWIERSGVDTATLDQVVGALLGRTPGVEQALVLDDEGSGWAVLGLEPDRGATLAVAVALSDALEREVLRVRLSRSRRLRIEHVVSPRAAHGARRRVHEVRWPERDGQSGRLDPGVWPVGVLAEPVLEALSASWGFPAAWALVPPRGYRSAGLSPREVTAAPAGECVLTAEGPLRAMASLPGAPGAPAALLVLDAAVSHPAALLPSIEGVRARVVEASPRWGAAGQPHLVAQAELWAPPAALTALERWWAALAPRPEVVQGLWHRGAFNPLLQVDLTPWEAVWGLPPLSEREPGWAGQPRAASDEVLLPATFDRPAAPAGSVVQGRLARRAQAPWSAWRRWLAPVS